MQRIAKGLTRQDCIVLLAINFIVSSLIPMANVFLANCGLEGILLSTSLKIPMAMEKVFFYPLIGYYLEYHVDVKRLKAEKIFILIAIALMGIFVSSGFTYYESISRGVFTQNYVQLFDYVIAMVAYIVIKYIVDVKCPFFYERKISNIICKVGSLTFGMYLLDPLLYRVMTNNYLQLLKCFGDMKGSLGWCVFSMFLGGCITFILKKVPIFKNIL